MWLVTWAEKVCCGQESLAAGFQHPRDLADVLVGDVQIHVNKDIVEDDEV